MPKSTESFKLLRKVLKAIGLSLDDIDSIVSQISALLGSPGHTSAKEPFPYRQRDNFMSAAEMSFYHILQMTAVPHLTVCPKVNLGDIFYANPADTSQRILYRNRIDRKHVDFLLCQPQTLKPVVAIELDDKSHQQPKRQQRDRFVEGVFAAAGLPLLRVPVQHTYNTAFITDLLAPYLPQPQSLAATSDLLDTPCCPKCGQNMVQRTVRQGDRAGQQFWGCADYPQCRGIRPLAP